MKSLITRAAAGFALVGCASSPEALQRATAASVGGNLAPEQITVASVDRGMMDVHWTALAKGHTYACSADDMLRQPASCVRR